MGAIATAQGLAAQSQLNFTRENEYEADRVGIGILASSGLRPERHAGFFEKMGRRTQLSPDWVPELLRTHPVTSCPHRRIEGSRRAVSTGPRRGTR